MIHMTGERAPILAGLVVIILGALVGTVLDWPAIAYYAVMAASIAVYFATLSWAERPHR